MMTCPLCKKQFADEIGATEGPREYHADCWAALTDGIKKAYNEASGQWDGWDWSHSFGGVVDDCEYCKKLSTCGVAIVIDPDDPDLDDTPAGACDHYRSAIEEARKYRDACQGLADQAASLAGDAMDECRSGNFEGALAAISEACDLESSYGDCPTWRPVRDAIETVIGKIQESENETVWWRESLQSPNFLCGPCVTARYGPGGSPTYGMTQKDVDDLRHLGSPCSCKCGKEPYSNMTPWAGQTDTRECPISQR